MQQTAKKHVGHAFSQFRLTNDLLQNLYKHEITPTAKLVLLYLSSCYNPKKADMFPKQKTIAAKIGLSERSIVRAIQELIKAGLIVVECKYSNRYKFTSKIVSKQPQDEKFFEPENMADDLGQNDLQNDDKMSHHDIEPMNEPIKQPQSSSEDKYLLQYAKLKKAKNPQKYIEAIKKLGGADEVIKEMKTIEANAAGMVAKAKKVQEDLEFARANRAEVSPEFFERVRLSCSAGSKRAEGKSVSVPVLCERSDKGKNVY